MKLPFFKNGQYSYADMGYRFYLAKGKKRFFIRKIIEQNIHALNYLINTLQNKKEAVSKIKIEAAF
jgi:hypothetical protein